MRLGAVPRFYFHLYDNDVVRDEYGRDLPNDDVMRREALKEAREMICAEIESGTLNLDHRIEVEDERGVKVLTLAFKDAVAVEGSTH